MYHTPHPPREGLTSFFPFFLPPFKKLSCSCFSFSYNFNILFTYFHLHWVFIAPRGLSRAAAHGGLLSCSGNRASPRSSFSCFRAQALGAQAQQLWHTGLVAARLVGSCRARAQTCVPFIGRWILNHWTTRETLELLFNCLCPNSLFWWVSSLVPISSYFTYIYFLQVWAGIDLC